MTRRRTGIRQLLMFLSIIGPGIITANADNDVGGIATYSLAGVQFGYSLLWLLIPVTVILYVAQEMGARMGVVTGKGLADLIRENFGVKVTFWVLLLFVLGDLGNVAAEFSGVSSSATIFHGYTHLISPLWLVPVVAIFVFTTVTSNSRKVVERIFFAFCAVYLAYIVSGIIVHPNWHDVLRGTFLPTFTPSKAYFLMIVGVIGTTIAPWQQFYIQAAAVEKGVPRDDYRFTQWDVAIGSISCDVVAFFIIVASAATIFVFNQAHVHHQLVISLPSDVAMALQPLAGKFASLLFAIGLLNAAMFTASILPLSTAYYVCEAFGFERGVELRFKQAPIFYSLYLAFILIGAGVVLLPGAPLLGIIFYSQVINGALLPVVLFLMLLLINNKRLMGAWTNSFAFNVIAWATVIVVATLTVISIVTSLFPSLVS
jgi:NRAMP (natural resistance-associated macrophage protein)-like metal ion transporter